MLCCGLDDLQVPQHLAGGPAGWPYGVAHHQTSSVHRLDTRDSSRVSACHKARDASRHCLSTAVIVSLGLYCCPCNSDTTGSNLVMQTQDTPYVHLWRLLLELLTHQLCCLPQQHWRQSLLCKRVPKLQPTLLANCPTKPLIEPVTHAFQVTSTDVLCASHEACHKHMLLLGLVMGCCCNPLRGTLLHVQQHAGTTITVELFTASDGTGKAFTAISSNGTEACLSKRPGQPVS